ncbi:MAG: hypothetical protein H0W10_06960 [Chloroflexi bacterium]|nr:hypothetical protein [Chloroflexota bacterium]
MLNFNHPDDERLSALAFRDTDATADTSLTAHVSSCDRCTDLVNDLGALRASLAELPDLQPSRPLRLLPEVEAEPVAVDRFGGWARRFFAPVLTAGAALAMVGMVGTALPALNGMASSAGGQADSAESTMAVGEAAGEAPGEAAPEASVALGAAAPSERTTTEGADPAGDGFTDASASAAADGFAAASASTATEGSGEETENRALASDESDRESEALTRLAAERSPWPMVLFTGIALMVAAALLRWILVPRAG